MKKIIVCIIMLHFHMVLAANLKWKLSHGKTEVIIEREVICGKDDSACVSNPDQEDKIYQLKLIASKTDKKNIKDPIMCRSGKALNSHKFECLALPRNDGLFYVFDCYIQDSVMAECSIRLFEMSGVRVVKFKPSFRTTNIFSVQLTKTNQLEITGLFQSQEIDGLNDEKRNACEDEACVGFDGISSHAKLVVDDSGKILSKESIK